MGLGGDMTAAYEAEEWAEAHKEGKKMTTSCCPAFVNMIKQHFPMLLENMSTTVSPMCAVSRMIKSQDPETITVFIGPCIAKKSESLDLNVEGQRGLCHDLWGNQRHDAAPRAWSFSRPRTITRRAPCSASASATAAA